MREREGEGTEVKRDWALDIARPVVTFSLSPSLWTVTEKFTVTYSLFSVLYPSTPLTVTEPMKSIVPKSYPNTSPSVSELLSTMYCQRERGSVRE